MPTGVCWPSSAARSGLSAHCSQWAATIRGGRWASSPCASTSCTESSSSARTRRPLPGTERSRSDRSYGTHPVSSRVLSEVLECRVERGVEVLGIERSDQLVLLELRAHRVLQLGEDE